MKTGKTCLWANLNSYHNLFPFINAIEGQLREAARDH